MATTRRRPAKPFTVAHFKRYTSRLVYDDGERRDLEPWQLDYAKDLFARRGERPTYKAAWLCVPEGNGKSTLIAELALYGADYSPTPWVPVAASSRDQAETIYTQAKGFVDNTSGLDRRFICHDGYRVIDSLRNGGKGIKIYPATPKTGDGVIPFPYAIIDELHRQADLELYRLWNGKLRKRKAQILVISTAGEPGSEFEETRDRMLNSAARKTTKARGAYVRAEGGGTVLHDWAVRDRAKCGDMNAVARANPRKDLTPTVMGATRDDPTISDEHFQRFVCNIATRISGQGLEPAQWNALYEEGVEPDLAAKAYGWLDLGWEIDTTAMGVLVWESDERRVITGVRILLPPVDEGDVVAGLLNLQEEFAPVGFVYDPNAGGRQMAQLLEKGTHPLQTDDDERLEYGLDPLAGRKLEPLVFIEHTQDNAPMALAASRFDEAVRAKWFVHDGDPELRRHVLNAVRRGLGGEKYRYDRPPDAKGEKRRKYPIDALTGVLMGHSIAVDQCEQEEAVPLVAWR